MPSLILPSGGNASTAGEILSCPRILHGSCILPTVDHTCFFQYSLPGHEKGEKDIQKKKEEKWKRKERKKYTLRRNTDKSWNSEAYGGESMENL